MLRSHLVKTQRALLSYPLILLDCLEKMRCNYRINHYLGKDTVWLFGSCVDDLSCFHYNTAEEKGLDCKPQNNEDVMHKG